MLLTSAEANKMLKKLNEEYRSVLRLEEQSKSFVAAVGENVDDVKPAYDFEAVQSKLDEISGKIIVLKHALNIFNTTHKVPGFDMTVDEMLVWLPVMTGKLQKLSSMKDVLPKTRGGDGFRGAAGNIIEYKYANYDIAAVGEAYDRLNDVISRAQVALDSLNTTEKFEVADAL